MLSRVVIQNFKSIGAQGVDLELKPLTFLVGPNGGGKSSIIEAIGVAAQDSPKGQSADFHDWTDIVHRRDGSSTRVRVDFDPSLWGDPQLGFVFQVEIQPNGGIRRPVSFVFDSQEVASLSEKNKVLINRHRNETLKPRTFLLSSVRGSVPYTANTGADPDWVGMYGQDLTLILAKEFGQSKNRHVAHKIGGWANRFGTRGLNAGFWGRNEAGADYSDSHLDANVNLSLSSSGAKQILTVITQLFWAPKGSLIMIEEPEISLHPKAQLDVLEVFSEAINDDAKQIIATTHSLFLMQGIGYAVHKGWLDSEQIAVYHVEKKKDTGTVAKRLKVKKTGYIQGWIPSFNKVERDLLREWAKTLPRA